MREPILEFEGEYRFLSNFYQCMLSVDGVIYHSSEAAYQAQKCYSFETRVRTFSSIQNPHHAKRQGRLITVRPDWEQVKVGEMYRVLTAKFTQNPFLGRQLQDTEDAYLEEGNSWGDTFWGVSPVGSKTGSNHLGQLLMRVRRDLITK